MPVQLEDGTSLTSNTNVTLELLGVQYDFRIEKNVDAFSEFRSDRDDCTRTGVSDCLIVDIHNDAAPYFAL